MRSPGCSSESDGGIFEVIGHGHRGHEPGDGVVLEKNLAVGGSVPTTTPRTGYCCEGVVLTAGGFAVPRQPVMPKAIAADRNEQQNTGRADTHDESPRGSNG